MTYLDPDQARTTPNWGHWTLKTLAVLAVLAFGWFAFTVGTEDSGRPQIVAEPTVQTTN